MEKSELKEYVKHLLKGILMYFMIMLFVRGFDINIKEIFGHFLFSIVMGAIWYFILVKILGFIAGVFKIGADATILTIASTKQYFDEQKEKRERALQAEIDEMARQDQIKREKIINSYEYQEQQRREKHIEDIRRYVRRLTDELINIPAYDHDKRAEYEKSLKEAIDRLETLERAEKAFKHIDLP
ncbi:hypothetical protein [Campylobacter concisus]|uniref:hypothetical protein n=1 Tax=Campylobacter concisus TaxID=199 RepID=UPI00112F9D8D|nr:hypothetical protein [Campylobacter concisus]